MNAVLPAIGIGVVFIVGTMWAVPSWRRAAAGLSIFVPAPFFVWACTADAFIVDMRWVILGSRFGLDETGRVFLAITSALWMIAGLYAHSYLATDPRRTRFFFFYYLSMVGNIGVTITHDILSYLAFYSLMGLAAYGLVVHDGSAFSRWAGKIYLIFTVLGELILYAAAVLAVRESGVLYFDDLRNAIAFASTRDACTVLFLCGFGIKLGIMPLHSWLVAYPAAPTPASAVLSGAMLKTGLLGLLRVLPFGLVSFDFIGQLVVAAAILTTFAAVFIGLMQSDAKAVLGYSSISQMGLVMTGVVVALMVPEVWTAARPMLLFFVVHHAVAKTALFLGVGVAEATGGTGWRRYGIIAGLIWSALSLSGLPLTTGLAAKDALKHTFEEASGWWPEVLYHLVPVTSIATTLIMARYLWLVWPSAGSTNTSPKPGVALPWAVLVLGVTVNWLACARIELFQEKWITPDASAMWAALWPMVIAGILVACAAGIPGLRRLLSAPRLPAGDIVVPVSRVLAVIWANIRKPVLYQKLRDRIHEAGQAGMRGFRWGSYGFARLGRLVESEHSVGLFVSILVLLLLLAVVT